MLRLIPWLGLLAVLQFAASAQAQVLPGGGTYTGGGVGVGIAPVPSEDPEKPPRVQPQPSTVPPPANVVPPVVPVVPVSPLAPGAGTIASSVLNPATAGVPPTFANPGFGYPFFPFTIDPYGGTLRGSAEVIKAQGQYLIDRQEALLKFEEYKQARLDRRRRAIDEYIREKEILPSDEDLRQEAKQEILTRSLNNPPEEDVISGRALNSILDSLAGIPAASRQKPEIPVDPDIVRQVNVSKGTGSGNLGLLRNKGKLSWPNSVGGLAPQAKTEELCNTIEIRIREAYDQARVGKVDGNLLRNLSKLTNELNALLLKNVNTLSFNDYAEAKNYLKNLKASIQLLGQPDATEFIAGRYQLDGKTVPALVDEMLRKGLKFGPAVGGAQPAYVGLHRAMVQFYNAISPRLITSGQR